MKRAQIKALHQKTVAELNAELVKLELELAKDKLELTAQKLEDTSKPDRLRKEVARIKTILTEKQQAATQDTSEKQANND